MQHTSIWQNEPLLDLEGNHFVRLENYQSILQLTDCLVRLKMKGYVYEIGGQNIQIRSVTKREIFVEGIIEQIVIRKEEAK